MPWSKMTLHPRVDVCDRRLVLLVPLHRFAVVASIRLVEGEPSPGYFVLVGRPFTYSNLVVCLVAKVRFLPFLIATNIELS